MQTIAELNILFFVSDSRKDYVKVCVCLEIIINPNIDVFCYLHLLVETNEFK